MLGLMATTRAGRGGGGIVFANTLLRMNLSQTTDTKTVQKTNSIAKQKLVSEI